MMVTRRSFMQSMLALGVAPSIVRAENIMRTRVLTLGTLRTTVPIAYASEVVETRLSDIVGDIFRGSGLADSDFDLTGLDEVVSGCVESKYSYAVDALELVLQPGVTPTALWANGRQIDMAQCVVSPNGILRFKSPFELTEYGNCIPTFDVEMPDEGSAM